MARGPVDVDSCFLLTVNLQDNAHILAAIDCQASALGNSRCVGLGPGQTQAPALQAWSPTFLSQFWELLCQCQVRLLYPGMAVNTSPEASAQARWLWLLYFDSDKSPLKPQTLQPQRADRQEAKDSHPSLNPKPQTPNPNLRAEVSRMPSWAWVSFPCWRRSTAQRDASCFFFRRVGGGRGWLLVADVRPVFRGFWYSDWNALRSFCDLLAFVLPTALHHSQVRKRTCASRIEQGTREADP